MGEKRRVTIDGETFDAAAVRKADAEGRILPLLRRVHHDISKYFRGPVLAFWVFQSMRGYGIALREGGSRMAAELPRFSAINETLEAAVGPVNLVFGHNDLLAANFIDDGDRLWLVDWDYAGWSSPYFDLAGLAANNEFDSEREERLLRGYFGEEAGALEVRRGFDAIDPAPLLR